MTLAIRVATRWPEFRGVRRAFV